MRKSITPAIALFRLKDHIFFTIPLVIMGFVIATRLENVRPNLNNLLVLLAANVMAVSFAFAINEIEDAPDDKIDPNKNNPLAKGRITKSQATILCCASFLVSLVLFYTMGHIVSLIGASILVLSFLYSYKTPRLKSKPILDLVSHGLMLSGLILLSSYASLSRNYSSILPLFVGVTLISVYGQFFNQVRDFKADQKAKITNTTMLLGKTRANILMNIILIAGVSSTVYGFYKLDMVIYLAPIAALTIPIIYLFRGYASSRDKKSRILGSDMHIPSWILVNLLALYLLLSILF